MHCDCPVCWHGLAILSNSEARCLVLGLMTWPDIGFHVHCDPLDPSACYESLQSVAIHPRTLRVTFSNRLGDRRGDNEPEGWYSGIRFRSDIETVWKIDVWFVMAQPVPPEFEMMEWIRARLTPESRLAILRLKSLWHDSPSYRNTVTSVDVYQAVLDHGIESPQAFEAYLQRTGRIV
jgi:hypothetical protein